MKFKLYQNAGSTAINPHISLMRGTTKANNKWAGKLFSIGIVTGILAIILTRAYPQYWAPIVYGACGVIFYLMIRIAREIEWRK